MERIQKDFQVFLEAEDFSTFAAYQFFIPYAVQSVLYCVLSKTSVPTEMKPKLNKMILSALEIIKKCFEAQDRHALPFIDSLCLLLGSATSGFYDNPAVDVASKLRFAFLSKPSLRSLKLEDREFLPKHVQVDSKDSSSSIYYLMNLEIFFRFGHFDALCGFIRSITLGISDLKFISALLDLFSQVTL